jgi:hypothetical protein
MSGNSDGTVFPPEFDQAVANADKAVFRPELAVRDIPAPEGIAPYAKAWSSVVSPEARGGDHGTSRLVILFDPSEPEGWSGRFRAVCFAKAPLDQSMGEDPMLPRVAWSWLTDALDQRGAQYHRAAGTASTIVSTGFGELHSDSVGAEIEMRASWSPLDDDLSSHLEAWSEFVCMLAGFPPTTEGVTALRAGRS